MTFFCPACFHEIPEGTGGCPHCGASIGDWDRRYSYGERLIQALDHPLAEVRMAAIIALGKRRDAAAAEPLARCAQRHPADVVEGLEIVRSVANLTPGRERSRALRRLRRYPARAVRREAARLLAGSSRAPEEP
jgi:HEAT repeat protein